MNSTTSIIVVWAVLGGVVAAYVIYRLITDRRTDAKRHILYPLVSNASDGMFPERGDIFIWVGYMLALLGMLGFLGILYMESTGKPSADYLVNVAGVFLASGLLLLGLSKLKKRWRG
jgi:choline-glycine betaine transporter